MQQCAGQQCPAALNPVLSALPHHYLIENTNLRLDLAEVLTLPLTKFFNPIRKPPNKTIPLLQTSLSPSSWGPETPILKAYWATVQAWGHRFSKHPKSGSPRESLDAMNSSAMSTQACVDPNSCRENITAPWLVGTGVSKEALAWPQALLLPCSHGGRSSEQRLYEQCQHLSWQRSLRGSFVCPGLAHKSQAVQERHVSCFCQAIRISWPISKVSQICACLSDVNHMLVWGKFAFPCGASLLQAGAALDWTNITNGDLQLLSVGVSQMKQSRSKKKTSFYPVSVGIRTFKTIL